MEWRGTSPGREPRRQPRPGHAAPHGRGRRCRRCRGDDATAFVPQPDSPTPVEFTASANATSGLIVVAHGAGSAIDVREIDVRIAVDGTPLRYRSPVPFAGSTGYRGAPGGPFNDASDPRWEVGERASFEVAGTNAPSITAGSSLRVERYRDDPRSPRPRPSPASP